jgi:hypothetical protein
MIIMPNCPNVVRAWASCTLLVALCLYSPRASSHPVCIYWLKSRVVQWPAYWPPGHMRDTRSGGYSWVNACWVTRALCAHFVAIIIDHIHKHSSSTHNCSNKLAKCSKTEVVAAQLKATRRQFIITTLHTHARCVRACVSGWPIGARACADRK